VTFFAPLFYVLIEQTFGAANRVSNRRGRTRHLTTTHPGITEMKQVFPSVCADSPWFLAGCTMAPKYEPPRPLPRRVARRRPAYSQRTAAAIINSRGSSWREFFADAKLQQVIAMALTNNRDLRLAP
jgi:hypothetical protein